MNVSHVLKAHDLFLTLTPNEVNKISEHTAEKRFKKDEVIYPIHRRAEHVFLNLEGEVGLRMPAEEGPVALAISKASKGELFGVSRLVGISRYTVTAVANTNVSVLAIDAKPLLEVLRANPTANNAITGQVAKVYYSRYITVLETLHRLVDDLRLIG